MMGDIGPKRKTSLSFLPFIGSLRPSISLQAGGRGESTGRRDPIVSLEAVVSLGPEPGWVQVCPKWDFQGEGVRVPCPEACKHRLLRESCLPWEGSASTVWQFLALDPQRWGGG